MTQNLARRLRVGLIGEGTYPIAEGGVSTWYHQLVTGLADHDFSVVTLVGEQTDFVWDVPDNVTSVDLIPVWDPPRRNPLRGRRAERRRVAALVRELWAIVLRPGVADGDLITPHELERARAALEALSLENNQTLLTTLLKINTSQKILEAWNRTREATPSLPPMTLSEAAQAAGLADRILAVLDVGWPEVDVTHVSSSGPASLIGLARKWRDGVPLVLTEHGIYLRERYLALHALDLPWTVRAALGFLIRLISEVTYLEADLLAPVSEFNARWEQRLGADYSRVRTLYNGVDESSYPVVTTEPELPTISFVGRIDPLKDLHTLLEAFQLVRATIPTAHLRLYGPVPEQNQGYFEELTRTVDARFPDGAVTFEGPASSSMVAIEAGHVVVLSSISEGLPFTLIEAMMAGRATVSTDVGGVREVVGPSGGAGLVVPPRDPVSLSEGMISLLRDSEHRHMMGRLARERAVMLFTLERFHDQVRDLYTAASARRAWRDAAACDTPTPPPSRARMRALVSS